MLFKFALVALLRMYETFSPTPRFKGRNMSSLLSLSVVCAVLACGSVADEKGMVDPQAKAGETSFETEGTQTDTQIAVATETDENLVDPTPATMVEFDGGHDFLKMSRRLRVWRTSVQFDMTVDAEGHATDCEVVDRFRKTYVNMKLCEVVMNHSTFEPARDDHNQPIEGSYRHNLSYADLREQLDR